MNKTRFAMLAGIATLRAAFNNRAGWKLDADGKIEMRDGNPVYVTADGTEATVGGDTIATLRNEAKTHRIAKEEALAKLENFKDIDPVAARKALDTVKNIDAKKLIDAGEVEKVRDAMKAEFTGQLTEAQKNAEALQSRINDMTRSDAFKSSRFIAERIAVPPEMFEATFGKNFKVEDGKVVPYFADGNKVFSKKRVGEIADIDEAFELIVDAYPHKDAILKAQGNSGSGNNGGGGNRGGGQRITRADFDKLGPAQQADAAGKMRSGEMTITD